MNILALVKGEEQLCISAKAKTADDDESFDFLPSQDISLSAFWVALLNHHVIDYNISAVK